MQHYIRAGVKLIRPDSSLLAFLSILVAVFARTHEIALSLHRSFPILFTSMCTFIANDLDDIEKDRINHPERPLPSGQVKTTFVAVLYFTCLAAALFSIRFSIGTNKVAFLYYLLLIMAISYRYVVEYLSSFKPLYVAVATAVPILILAQYYPRETSLNYVATAILLFVLGRELCKDLPDRAGDPVSYLHRFAPSQIVNVSFIFQITGLVTMSRQVKGLAGIVDILLMIFLLFISYFFWLRYGELKTATRIMKGIIFLGLYFLL